MKQVHPNLQQFPDGINGWWWKFRQGMQITEVTVW